MSSSPKREPETTTQKEFQRSLGVLDVIAARNLWGSAPMILLLPVTIALLSFPSLFAFTNISHGARWVLFGLLASMWIANGFALYRQKDRLEILRKSLIAQMEGAARSHVRAEKFYGLSIIDPLTGLYNRRFGENRLREEIARARRAADPLLLLALDFDRFKQINDEYGHTTGDLALKTFSHHLQRAVRACDVPVRVGGDEFLVILPDCPPAKVPQIFSRMGSIVLTVDRKQVPVRFSYGIAQYEDGDTPETMIKRADKRLYDEKAKGRTGAPTENASGEKSALGQTPEKRGAKVRQNSRLAKKVSVVLTGDDVLGKVFLEQTDTVDLSQHGVAIISRHRLARNQRVTLRCLQTNQEAEARVVRVIESEQGSHAYGLAFVNTPAKIWGIEFQDASEGQKQAAGSLFECRLCKAREQGDFASDDGGAVIARSCRRCGTATPWERIPHSAASGSIAPQEPVRTQEIAAV